MNILRYFWQLLAINLKSSMSLRGAFLARMIFMAVNNLLIFVIWFIFFDRFNTINGWQLEHMALLHILVSVSFGFFVLCFHGLAQLSYAIDEGGVDLYLTQPKPVVLGLAGRHSDASGFGEMLTGALLSVVAWPVIKGQVHWLLLFVLCGAVFWFSLMLFLGSLSFWFKDMKDLVTDLFMSFLILGTQPASIYTGYAKVVILTILPIGYIAYFPIQFLIEQKLALALYSIAGVIAFFCLSLFLFKRGLRRYESGNRFGVQG